MKKLLFVVMFMIGFMSFSQSNFVFEKNKQIQEFQEFIEFESDYLDFKNNHFNQELKEIQGTKQLFLRLQNDPGYMTACNDYDENGCQYSVYSVDHGQTWWAWKDDGSGNKKNATKVTNSQGGEPSIMDLDMACVTLSQVN